MKTSEVLTAARALIERGWTQGVPARNVFGDETGVNARDATCFCATGAVTRAVYDHLPIGDWEHARRGCYVALCEASPQAAVVTYNDASWRTQDEVLAMFDKAIEQERARELGDEA